VITRAQQQTTSIFTIGLGRGIGFPPLQDIARETGGTFAEVVDANVLANIFQAIGVGIVEGRVMVIGAGRFDPPLAHPGAYIVSGALVTTVDGQSVDTPFSFPVDIVIGSFASVINGVSDRHIPSAEEEVQSAIAFARRHGITR
jgi:hypothetical protein